MDSNLTMFFNNGYVFRWAMYTEVDHDVLRRMIRIEQTNFEFCTALMDKYQSVNLSIMRLN